MHIPSTLNEFSDSAIETWNNYCPVITEVQGVVETAAGVVGLTYSILWRMNDAEDNGTGKPLATQAIEISAVFTAVGMMKLAIPVICLTTYGLVRNYSWIG